MGELHHSRLPSWAYYCSTLYLAPHNSRTVANLRAYLRNANVSFSEPYPDLLAVTLGSEGLRDIGFDLQLFMTHVETQRTMCLLVPDGVVPTIRELMYMQPLNALLATVDGEWLTDTLREERLVSHFQPIVYAAEPHRIFAYECLLRSTERDGTLVYPDRLFGVARSADLLAQLDQAARLQAVRSASQFGLASKVFINYNPSAIDEPKRSLQPTLRAIAACGIDPERIVFEMVETSERDVKHLLSIVTFLRAKGFKLALDDLGAGYNSIDLLPRLRPEYIKLNIEFIRGIDRDPYKAQVVSKLLDLVKSLGIETIAEGVETRAEWRWALENGADYAQGYLFARPGSPPPRPKSFEHTAAMVTSGWSQPN